MKPAIVSAIVLPHLLLVAMLAGCIAPPPAPAEPAGAPPPIVQTEPEIVTFPDKNLELVIREALGKPADEEILSTELAQLTELKARDAGITDLSGIEYCTNLTVLGFWGNPISDVSPVSSLPNLSDLHLCESQISDIHPLSSLTNLKWLAVASSPVSDISPLSALTNLTVLDLASDEIRDISPLSSLTNLTILCLQGNEVSNILSLTSLTNLTDLRLTQNQVSDISPLLANSGLGEGDSVLLGGNNLDLSPGSADMENIEILEVRGVVVSLDPQQWAPGQSSPGAPAPLPVE